MGLFILVSLNSFSILDLLFELLFLLESAATPTYYFRPILKFRTQFYHAWVVLCKNFLQ